MESDLICLLFLGLLILVESEDVRPSGDDTVGGHSKVVVCYWGTWANYRPKDGKFTPESVDGSLCTHLIYSFAGLDGSKSRIKSLDTWMDLEKDYGLAGFRKATDLKKTWPHLKVMLAIGGWNEGSTKYSGMAADPKKREKFVNSTLDFLEEHKFDGLDLDWEYPAKRGGSKQDKKNFVLLVKELKEAFIPRKYLLTAAIGAGKGTIDISYEVAEMYKYLDLVNVMCYDYHGKWDKRTGHNAPLRPRPDETGGNIFLNLEYSINYLLKLGAKPEKTVLGVPLYGRSFLLKDKSKNGMGAPARSTSFAGPITREAGFLGYNEICKELTTPGGNWTVVWEACHQAPFMVRGDRWVSYDDEKSVTLKAEFSFDMKLGGVMVWSVETDDFKGLCSNGSIKFPLLRTLNTALSKKEKGEEREKGEEEACDPDNYVISTAVSTTPYTSGTAESGDSHPTYAPPGSAAPSAGGGGGSGVCVKPNEPNPDLTDCSQFYLCAAGVPHLISCRPGTLYSPALMTCDHATNVDCQVQAPPPDQEEEKDEKKEEKEQDIIEVNDVDQDDLKPLPLPVPTVPARPSTTSTTRKAVTRYTTERFQPLPVTPKDESPLPDVDTNHISHIQHPAYTPSDTLRRHNTRKLEKEEELIEDGMNAEKVVIIFLVLALLLVLFVLAWCFRTKIREFSEPYYDAWQQKARKPSTVGLLHAYKLNKIPWPQKNEPNTAPPPPPKDYRFNRSISQIQTRPVPPATPPRDYTLSSHTPSPPNTVTKTTITLPYSGTPGLQPYSPPANSPRPPYVQVNDPTYCEIQPPKSVQKPEAPPRRKRSVGVSEKMTESVSEV